MNKYSEGKIELLYTIDRPGNRREVIETFTLVTDTNGQTQLIHEKDIDSLNYDGTREVISGMPEIKTYVLRTDQLIKLLQEHSEQVS